MQAFWSGDISTFLATPRAAITGALAEARYETVIFVPLGDVEDATRSPAVFDAVVDFLKACGVRELQGLVGAPEQVSKARQAVLF